MPRRARPTASYVRPPTRGPPRLTNFLAAAGEAGGDGGPGGSPGGGHARPASIRPRTQPFFTNPFPCLLVGGGGRAGDPMIARDINNEPGATEGQPSAILSCPGRPFLHLPPLTLCASRALVFVSPALCTLAAPRLRCLSGPEKCEDKSRSSLNTEPHPLPWPSLSPAPLTQTHHAFRSHISIPYELNPSLNPSITRFPYLFSDATSFPLPS